MAFMERAAFFALLFLFGALLVKGQQIDPDAELFDVNDALINYGVYLQYLLHFQVLYLKVTLKTAEV